MFKDRFIIFNSCIQLFSNIKPLQALHLHALPFLLVCNKKDFFCEPKGPHLELGELPKTVNEGTESKAFDM